MAKGVLDALDEMIVNYDAQSVQQIFVSNNGDDSEDGLSRETAIKSRKRLMQLSVGNIEWVLMEGKATQERLEMEAAEAVDFLQDSATR
jgi:hypothetical protein